MQKAKEIISNFKTNSKTLDVDDGLMWDTLKCEIRGYTIAYATARKKEKIRHELELKERLKFLEENLCSENYLEYSTIQMEIEQINKEYALGIQLRSRVKHMEETEQNVSIFSKQEIRNYNIRHIKSLYKHDNTSTDDPNEILEEQELYYSKLYQKPSFESIDNELFEHKNIPKLTINEKKKCDEPISITELGLALKELPNKKAPGTDGFTSEFFKFFWPDIRDVLFNSLVYAYKKKSLSIEQRRGILTLIPKKDKDLRYLKNWRPLTLLNTDYKVLTKLLARRLQKVISKLVSYDQSGYIKGWFIGENIRNIFDIIDYTKIYNKPGMIVTIDFEKAFDSIAWEFLFKTMQTFNFGEYFTTWIQILYNDSQCCVTNNGYSSQFFRLSRGIRQGCPISALLFVLVVEIMAIRIRHDKDIQGINYAENKQIKLSQLADDTTLFLKDEKSLQRSLKVIEHFGNSSGLKLNTEKSEAFWIGSDIDNMNKPFKLKWTKNYIKCLGVYCGPDSEGAIMLNFEKKINKI